MFSFFALLRFFAFLCLNNTPTVSFFGVLMSRRALQGARHKARPRSEPGAEAPSIQARSAPSKPFTHGVIDSHQWLDPASPNSNPALSAAIKFALGDVDNIHEYNLLDKKVNAAF